MHVITTALDLRARRPETFASAYLPVPAGPNVCAFLRGEEDVLVVVPVRPGSAASLVLPEGARREWRELLGGEAVELDRVVPLEDVLSPLGVGLLECE